MATGLRERAIRVNASHSRFIDRPEPDESGEDFQHLNRGRICNRRRGIAGRETWKSRREQQIRKR